ncbi:cytidine deaminase-like protein [Entophlyctis helioformis]|nr:cytidine deaminase-like protein [Entophlyctis helioformis]
MIRKLPEDLLAHAAETGTLSKEAEAMLGDWSRQAKEASYSPYSKFRVGAALLAKSGNVWLGCNVENASYGGCICAERTAFVKAVSEGDRRFHAIAITSDTPKPISPCGMCRQFMVEFGKDLLVLQFSADLAQVSSNRLRDLLPDSFGPEDLDVEAPQ